MGNKTDLLQKNDDDDELNDIVNPTAKKSVDLKKAQQYADVRYRLCNRMNEIFRKWKQFL